MQFSLRRDAKGPKSGRENMATMAANIHESGHPLIMHKITQMRKSAARPKYLHTLIKEFSTFLCYEATKDLPLEACDVQTLCGAERGLRLAQRVHRAERHHVAQQPRRVREAGVGRAAAPELDQRQPVAMHVERESLAR